jgi:hypothetical protein
MSNVTVFYGFWVNYESHPVVGATLTVPIRWGNYLIAGLSTLITWAGFSAWGISAYLFHMRLSGKKNKDILDHQLQVLSRSASGAFESFCEGAQLHFAWRKRAANISRRILPIAIAGFIVWFSFIPAGILVAEVASKDYDQVIVLGMPENCGDLETQLPIDADQRSNITELDIAVNSLLHYQTKKDRSDTKWARLYASTTYGNGSFGNNAKMASPFASATLPYTSKSVPCPWTISTRCLGPGLVEGPAWQLDSGRLNSHQHLGINTKPEDRISVRKLSTCGVIDTEAFEVSSFTNIPNTNTTLRPFIGLELLAEPQNNRNIPDDTKKVVLRWFPYNMSMLSYETRCVGICT